ncbi:hypothetical protein C8F01DRAFT_1125587 [Mycena amicta]|nr:hypothetical protein C8F01DRAFT_1125587 [Mycena amicta]
MLNRPASYSNSRGSLLHLFNLAALCLLCIALAFALFRGFANFSYARQQHVPSLSAVQLYPGTSPVWDLGSLPLVKMAVEDTSSLPLTGVRATTNWAALIPQGGGVVFVHPHASIHPDAPSARQPYMLSMYHQLRCLDVIRRMYAEAEDGDDVQQVRLGRQGRHCMNYLRQTMLCRGDLRLEPVQDPDGPHAVDMWGDMTCKDWRVVYDAVSDNHREWGGP